MYEQIKPLIGKRMSYLRTTHSSMGVAFHTWVWGWACGRPRRGVARRRWLFFRDLCPIGWEPLLCRI